LQALITASYDDDGKPGMKILELPPNSPIQGPNQVQPLMQNHQVSRESLTLLNSEQSRVVFGNLLTLPVSDGLLYIEPVYIRGTGENAYPQLKKVLVSFGKDVGYGNTLSEALDVLFGTGSAPPTSTPTPPSNSGAPVQDPSTAAAVTAIQKALESLRVAQQKGDFAGIGKAHQDLANAIKQFETAQKQKPATRPNGSPSPKPGG
jgi:uncharacterized membrane protein (UPF0182 family)